MLYLFFTEFKHKKSTLINLVTLITHKKTIASLLKRTALSHDGTMRLDVRSSKVTFSQLKTRKFVTTRFACQNAVHLNSELIYNYIFLELVC